MLKLTAYRKQHICKQDGSGKKFLKPSRNLWEHFKTCTKLMPVINKWWYREAEICIYISGLTTWDMHSCRFLLDQIWSEIGDLHSCKDVY